MKRLYKFADNRVFFDIGYGCGNACKYCYLDDADKDQIVYEHSDITNSIQELVNDRRFKAGKNGTVVSFCPHTEPFKSDSSISALLHAISLFAPYKNLMQFATKEVMPHRFIENIDNLIYSGQVVAFMSVSSLWNQEVFEPYASGYMQRFKNISRLRGSNIKSCVYMKPFLFDKQEYEALYHLICDTCPDALCVGIVYGKMNNESQNAFRHPTERGLLSTGTNKNMMDFIEFLNRHSMSHIFLTSTCVLAWLNKTVNHARIPYELCIFCNKECMIKKWGK